MYRKYRKEYVRVYGEGKGGKRCGKDKKGSTLSFGTVVDIISWLDDEPDTDDEASTPTQPENTPDTPPITPTETDPKPIPADSVPTKPPAIQVVDIDVNTIANKFMHHTSDYEENTSLIIRRGQAFDLSITVDMPFDKDNDILRLIFATSHDPQIIKRTMFVITPGSTEDLSEASAVIKSVEPDGENTIIYLTANLPYDSSIGYFRFAINMKKAGTKKFTRKHYDDDIYVLFNPWCKDDTTYLDNKEEIKEYVLNETGRIYTGHPFAPGRPWNFGQFQKDILDTALYLLDSSMLPYTAYSSPVRVSRTLSSKVNSNDNNGVLVGNWSGDYEDGISPTKWSGSVKILQQYHESDQPVQYGQCWVFSGLLTTVCRALGIPCRSVTNFSSAHDTDGSLTIDSYVDSDGKRSGGDSVWNFHVWNEAWFCRPDLPDQFSDSGWQAIDATPQELSGDKYQTGPSPLKAIKEGCVEMGYDTGFIFGEVNGDRVTWKKKRDGNVHVISNEKDSVGKNISTKAVGKDQRLDVTELYKYPEGSEEERDAVKRALRMSTKRDAIYKALDGMDHTKHLEMSFETSMGTNADAKFTFKAKNLSSEDHIAVGLFTVIATYYTGVAADDLMEKKVNLPVKAGQEAVLEWELPAKDWINRINEDASLGVYGHADTKGTDQTCVWKEDHMRLDKPEISMTPEKVEVKRGEEISVPIKFENPLDIDLTKCTLLVEGPGVLPLTEISVKDVGPKGTIEETIKVKSSILGWRELMATFHCRQLVNIAGVTRLKIEE